MRGSRAPDPLRDYSPRRVAWFCQYLSLYLARHFRAVRLHASGAPSPLSASTVLYSNHPSWWDPLLLMWLFRALWPETRVFGPMDAAALERYALFRRLGLFATVRGTWRGAAEFLRQGRRVLSEPRSALCVTAEGTFADPRRRPVHLERGVAHLLAAGHAAQAIPVAIEYPFWTSRHPEALVRFGAPVVANGRGVDAIHCSLEEALEQSLDALAAAALAQDEAAFEVLLDGSRRDVGGAYALWRRARGLVGRRRREPPREPLAREGPG